MLLQECLNLCGFFFFFTFLFLRVGAIEIDFDVDLLRMTLESLLLGGSGKTSSCCSAIHGILLQKNSKNSWPMQRDMKKFHYPFQDICIHLKRKFSVPGWQAVRGLIRAWLFCLTFSSFCCFHCPNSPEPFGGRFTGWTKNDSSLFLF